LAEVPRVAVIVEVVFALTDVVAMEKLAELFPAGIVTVAGGVADADVVESVTTIPPAGAVALIDTVPVDDFPPATVAGLSVKFRMFGGLIVSPVDTVIPFDTAVIVAMTWEETGAV